MPLASFPPLPGSLPHYHSGRASPERYDNRYEQGFSESFGTTMGKHSFDLIRSALPRRGHIQSVGIIDGLLANDKFCMSRHVRLSLSYSRRPNLTRRRTDWATDARAYPPAGITRHGGDDETALARTSGNSETPGREATLGPGLPGHRAVEPAKRADSRSGRKRQGGVP